MTNKKTSICLVNWTVDLSDGYKNPHYSSVLKIPAGMNLQKEVYKIVDSFEGTEIEDDWTDEDLMLGLEKLGIEAVKLDEEQDVVY